MCNDKNAKKLFKLIEFINVKKHLKLEITVLIKHLMTVEMKCFQNNKKL